MAAEAAAGAMQLLPLPPGHDLAAAAAAGLGAGGVGGGPFGGGWQDGKPGHGGAV